MMGYELLCLVFIFLKVLLKKVFSQETEIAFESFILVV